jgi:XisH protein
MRGLIQIMGWREMGAKDKFHEEVKRALIKDQWTVTDNPLKIESDGKRFEIDFGAERLIFADREIEKVAIEVKSFLNPSAITDFYGAMGQFLTYRLALEDVQPERILYLAVPDDIYRTFFRSTFIQRAIAKYDLLLVVYDPTQEIITQWIS